MTPCPHEVTAKITDRLGLMQDHGDGRGPVAPVLQWHYACIVCGATTSTHEVPHVTEDEQRAAVLKALESIENAGRVVRAWRSEFGRASG